MFASMDYILVSYTFLCQPLSHTRFTHYFSQIFLEIPLPYPVIIPSRSQNIPYCLQIITNPVSFKIIHLPSVSALRHKLLRAVPLPSIISLERLLNLRHLLR